MTDTRTSPATPPTALHEPRPNTRFLGGHGAPRQAGPRRSHRTTKRLGTRNRRRHPPNALRSPTMRIPVLQDILTGREWLLLGAGGLYWGTVVIGAVEFFAIPATWLFTLPVWLLSGALAGGWVHKRISSKTSRQRYRIWGAISFALFVGGGQVLHARAMTALLLLVVLCHVLWHVIHRYHHAMSDDAQRPLSSIIAHALVTPR